MDHEWFDAVGKKLKEIEQAKAQRYALAKGQIDKELHLHPMISSSAYWHRSDSFVTSAWFDWASRFPGQYLLFIRQTDRVRADLLASRPYLTPGSTLSPNSTGSVEDTRKENTKTLMARIVMLKLESLLPVVD
jgi:hypothetical protein